MFTQPKRAAARLTLRDGYATARGTRPCPTSCWPCGPGTATGGRWRCWSSGTSRRCGGSPATCSPIRRTPRTPPRSRLPSCAPGSTSSAGAAGSRPGSTAWSRTPAATSASGSAAAGTSRWTPSPSGRRPTAGRTTWRCSASSAARWPLRMADLSDEQRHVMVMKDVLSLSYEEIAEVLGDAGRHGQVPRPSRPCADAPRDDAGARGGLRVTEPVRRRSTGRRSRRSSPTATRSCWSTRSPSWSRASGPPGRYHVTDDAWYLRGHFPGRPIMPGVLQVEALAQVGAVCGLSHPDFAGRLALFAGIDDVRFKRIVRARRHARAARAEITRLRGPVGKADAEATVDGELACRAQLTFAPDGARGVIARLPSAASPCSAIGSYAPERRDVQRRDRDAWSTPATSGSRQRTGHPRAADRRRRRVDRRPRRRGGAERAMEDAGIEAVRDRPDRRRDRQPGLLLPGHRVADRRADRRRRRGRVRPVGGLHRVHLRARAGRTRRSRSGLADTVLVVGTEVFSRLLDWIDRSTCVLFGDGAGAVVLRRDGARSGLLGFELGADGSGRRLLSVAAAGHRRDEPTSGRYVQMNGPEVYKFATRVVVESARAVPDAAGLGVDDVDVFVPHQANQRIIDHAARRLGSRRAGFCQRRAVRQHVGRIDPDLPGRGLPRGAHRRRRHRADGRASAAGWRGARA